MPQKNRYEDRVAIITGGASGIGFATAELIVNEGGRVVLADLSEEKIKEAVAKFTGPLASMVYGSRCDVSRAEDVTATFQAALDHFGRVDLLVNNAGLMVFKALQDHTTEDWTRVLNVDLMGTFYFTKEAFLKMKPGSAIVNVSSVHAIETTPLVASYAAAKAAVLSLTRSAAIEGKEKGIRANAVLPGAIDTKMLWDNPNIKTGLEVINKTDVGRPEDIAETIAFLGSDEARFISGVSLPADGGRLARL